MKSGRWARASCVVLAVVSGVFGGCASTQSGSQVSLAPPKNYRQQIITKLRQMEDDIYALQYVGITKPKPMWLGIFLGGTRPAVCVQVERPNIFGARAAWYYVFYFENGRVDGHKTMATSALQQAMNRCEPPLTNITSLVRSRR